MNTALNRTTIGLLTNKSGGAVAQGDVVVVDSANATAFTTTTTSGYSAGSIGVVVEPNGIASNATGTVAFGGYVPVVNLSAAASLGDVFKAHSVAAQAVRHAAPVATGDFGQVLGTGTTPAAFLWGQPAQVSSGGSAPASGRKVITAGDYPVSVTSFADLDATNLSITLTTGAHAVLIGIVCNASANSVGLLLDVTIDGTRQGQADGLLAVSPASTALNAVPATMTYLSAALTAASHTFRVQARMISGSGTVYASTSVTPFVFWVAEQSF